MPSFHLLTSSTFIKLKRSIKNFIINIYFSYYYQCLPNGPAIHIACACDKAFYMMQQYCVRTNELTSLGCAPYSNTEVNDCPPIECINNLIKNFDTLFHGKVFISKEDLEMVLD